MEIFLRRTYYTLFQKLLVFILFLSPLFSYAQTEPPATINSTLSGRVLDAATKEPLPGAVVSILGTTHSVPTNAEGRFNFVTGQKFPYTLVIRFIGFETQEVVAKGSPVEIQMKTAFKQ